VSQATHNLKGYILGRLLLRFLPWWLFGLAALAFLPVTVAVGRDLWTSWTMLSAAQGSSPPSPVTIAAFDPARNVSPVDEVSVRGIWLRDLGVGTIVKEGADDAYIIIKDAQTPDYAALFFRDFEKAGVEAGLDALEEVNGQITIAGFREASPSAADAVTADLMARNLAAGPPVVLLEPYFGDRASALRGRQTFESIAFAIIAGINLIIFLVAIAKARSWRARVAARQPASSIPRVSAAARSTATPAARAAQGASPFPASAKPAAPVRITSTTAPTKPKDPFAKSPIHTPKGWFR
jgi:hypothetical protein